jgi:1-deoxy-D-xylulose-5-phosphate synthase
MFTAQQKNHGPFSIRYPRGRGSIIDWKQPFEAITIGKGQLLKKGTDVAILSLGTTSETIKKALDTLTNSTRFAHYDLRFVKPLDSEMLHTVFKTYQAIVVIEDGVLSGGIGSAILEFSNDHQYTVPIKRLGIPDRFIEHGNLEDLNQDANISVSAVQEVLKSL